MSADALQGSVGGHEMTSKVPVDGKKPMAKPSGQCEHDLGVLDR